MKKLIAICLVCISAHLSAALPPFAQSVRELDAILNGEEIKNYVPVGDMILQITRTPPGYILITNKRIVLIDVIYCPDSGIGPVKFKLIFKGPCDLEPLCSN